MSNRIRKSKYDNIMRLNESLLSENKQSLNEFDPISLGIGIGIGYAVYWAYNSGWFGSSAKPPKPEDIPEDELKKIAKAYKESPQYKKDLEKERSTGGTDTNTDIKHGGTPPYANDNKNKKLNEGCGCGGSKGTSEDNTHGDWIEGNLMKIDQMMGDIGGGGCGPGQHWCNETGDCHDDHSPQTEPLTITGMEVINLQERIGKRIMKEQTNPFAGGSGPNWDAAEDAWSQWNAEGQTGAPTPDQTFLDNMAGKGCGFYEKRLKAQVNSFVSQFGGSFGAGTNASNAPHQGSNPAWQSQKYARIMWLSDAVYDCNNASSQTNTSSTAQSANASCFYDFLNDPANDPLLTGPVCNNGNQAIAQGNMEQTKFRWQSIADCNMLDDKIAKMLHLSQTTTGCEQIRKAAKHEYLIELKQSCC